VAHEGFGSSSAIKSIGHVAHSVYPYTVSHLTMLDTGDIIERQIVQHISAMPHSLMSRFSALQTTDPVKHSTPHEHPTFLARFADKAGVPYFVDNPTSPCIFPRPPSPGVSFINVMNDLDISARIRASQRSPLSNIVANMSSYFQRMFWHFDGPRGCFEPHGQY